MYSRDQNRLPHPIRIPEHYGGTAFSGALPRRDRPDGVPESDRPTDLRFADVARPTTHETQKDELLSPAKPGAPGLSVFPPVPADPAREKDDRSPLPAVLPAKTGRPLPHGIGSEELLILSLILLLANSEEGKDTVLWLALLLFSG